MHIVIYCRYDGKKQHSDPFKIKKARSSVSENKLDEAGTLYEQIYNSNKANSELDLELAVLYKS